MESTYRIPEQNLPRLDERVEQLNRRARKLGVAEVVARRTGEVEEQTVWVTYDERDREVWFDTQEHARTFGLGEPRETLLRWIGIEIEGSTPKYAGWTFVATIQHAGEAGNILRAVPGETCPVEFRNVDPRCDQCKTARHRKDTYIVRHEDGRYAQVGRNCIADFLGGADPERYAAWAEMMAVFADDVSEYEGDEYIGRTRGGERTESRTDLLWTTAANIREHGWVSATAAKESEGRLESTRSRVMTDMAPPRFQPKDHRPAPVTDADKARAEKAMAWAQEHLFDVDPATLNDYQHNLRVALATERIAPRSIGLVCSLIYASERDEERALERKIKAEQIARDRAAAREASHHVGTIGERREFRVMVMGAREIASQFGATTLYTMRDADGNAIKWFCSSATVEMETGHEYTLVGTVKCHGEYDGVAQTTITRCKVKEA